MLHDRTLAVLNHLYGYERFGYRQTVIRSAYLEITNMPYRLPWRIGCYAAGTRYFATKIRVVRDKRRRI